MTTPPVRRRRRPAAARVVTILWRDIPAQVVAERGDEVAKALLPSRFQKAIDKAARVAGLTERYAYLQQWRRITSPLGDQLDPAAAASARVAELAERFDRKALAALVSSGGVDNAPSREHHASKERA